LGAEGLMGERKSKKAVQAGVDEYRAEEKEEFKGS
jgi:hypothetical protein